jgi:diketogulonate reductase-like aldo/keto reductase
MLHSNAYLLVASSCARGKRGALVEGYSPLGSPESKSLSEERIVEIAGKQGVSKAQVLVSWGCGGDGAFAYFYE